MQKATIVYYTVVEDPVDVHPNAFIIAKRWNDITVGDVKRVFPIASRGEFRFRFRVEAKDEGFWIDLKDDENVPITGKGVWMKVNRLEGYDKGHSGQSIPTIQQKQTESRTLLDALHFMV